MRISDWSSDVCSSDLAINPYAKLFWAVESKSSTVVLGKAGGTFDIELGAVPTVKAGAITLSATTWITVGPKAYWGTGVNQDGNVGVMRTGLKALTSTRERCGGREWVGTGRSGGVRCQ